MKIATTFLSSLLGFCATFAAAPEVETTIVASGESWSYYAMEGEPVTNWQTGAGTEGWKLGPTVIGWGELDQATAYATGKDASLRYPVAYFRKNVKVSKTDQARDLQIVLSCDDGCIAYVNGTEVGRARLREGPIKPYTAQSAFMLPIDTFSIPNTLLKDDNLIAVAVYQNDPGSSDMRFDAKVIAR